MILTIRLLLLSSGYPIKIIHKQDKAILAWWIPTLSQIFVFVSCIRNRSSINVKDSIPYIQSMLGSPILPCTGGLWSAGWSASWGYFPPCLVSCVNHPYLATHTFISDWLEQIQMACVRVIRQEVRVRIWSAVASSPVHPWPKWIWSIYQSGWLPQWIKLTRSATRDPKLTVENTQVKLEHLSQMFWDLFHQTQGISLIQLCIGGL